MISLCCILCFLLTVQLQAVHSELVEVPRNSVVVDREPHGAIDMACKSDYQSRLKWTVHKYNDSRNEVLYNGFYLRPDAKSYCIVITDEPGKCYLRLKNTAEVANTYICVEPGSLREASADLIWIKSNPICNNSSTEDLVNLTCSIEFRGNWAPTMEWKEQTNDGEEVLSVRVNTTTLPNQRITSTLVMPVQEGSRNYTCTTYFDLSGKPNTTIATNIPDYIRAWTASVLPKKTQDDISNFIVKIFFGSLVVTVIVALLVLGFVYFWNRKKERHSKRQLESSRATSVDKETMARLAVESKELEELSAQMTHQVDGLDDALHDASDEADHIDSTFNAEYDAEDVRRRHEEEQRRIRHQEEEARHQEEEMEIQKQVEEERRRRQEEEDSVRKAEEERLKKEDPRNWPNVVVFEVGEENDAPESEVACAIRAQETVHLNKNQITCCSAANLLTNKYPLAVNEELASNMVTLKPTGDHIIEFEATYSPASKQN